MRGCVRNVEAPDGHLQGFWLPSWRSAMDKDPAYVHAVPADYGAFYAARRRVGPDQYWHRINQFIFPIHTMVGGNDKVATLRSHLPIDDEHSILISQTASRVGSISEERRRSKEFTDPFWPTGGYVERTSDPHTYFYTKANKHNDYLRDYEVEKTKMMSGVAFVWNLQDRAMTELMCGRNGEPIYDRSLEHLGTTDHMCIVVRQQLIKAATAFRDRGELPANVENVELDGVHHACGIWSLDTDWIAASAPIRRPGAQPHACICGERAWQIASSGSVAAGD